MKKGESFVDELTTLMVQNNIVKEDEAEAMKKGFHESSQESFDNFLMTENLISRADLLNVLSKYYHVPAFDVVGHFFEHNLLRQFPKGFLLRNEIVPLQVDENMLIVVAAHPNNDELTEKIGDYVSYDIRFMVGLAQDITDAVSEFYELAPTEGEEDLSIRKEHYEQTKANTILLEDKDEEK